MVAIYWRQYQLFIIKALFFDAFYRDSHGLFVPLHRKECLLWKKK